MFRIDIHRVTVISDLPTDDHKFPPLHAVEPLQHHAC